VGSIDLKTVSEVAGIVIEGFSGEACCFRDRGSTCHIDLLGVWAVNFHGINGL
jgi:hypothetical protein